MEHVIAVLLVVLLVLNLVLFLRLSKPKKDAEVWPLVQQNIEGLRGTLAEKMEKISGQLGQLDEAQRQFQTITRDLADFQQKLMNPGVRGGVGETLLENLLAQVLPREHFTLKHRFRNGQQVDALVRLMDGHTLSVDSKFSLPNFRKLTEATTEEERKPARKAFVGDVLARAKEIAEKYICPDEGTLDFALMYVPMENVYYEIICDTSLQTELQEMHAIPVSPNMLYAYLQTIALGLRGLKIERSARQVLEQLSRLKQDFKSFEKEFDVLGNHLKNASAAYQSVRKATTQFGAQLDSVDSTIPLKTTEIK